MFRLSQVLAFFSISLWALGGAQAPLSAAAVDATLQSDAEAGVSFAPPFPVGQTKVGAQVDALIREDGTRTIPEGMTFTSAVYAPDGVPFVVVWRKPYSQPPTRADFDELAAFSAKSGAAAGERLGLKSFSFDATRLRGLGELPAASVPGGLASRVIVTPTRDAYVFVGLFDRDEVAITRAASRLAQSISVEQSRRLVLDDLARGFQLSTVWAALGAVLVLAGAWGLWWRQRRV